MKRWEVFWIVAGLMLWPVCVGSEPTKQLDEDVAVLDTMVVTAGRVEEKKSDVSSNITVVDEEEIKESGAQDLGDLLENEGFMVREYPNSLVSVSIRGFRTETHGNDLASHVLILIDGRRAGTGNLAKILMDNVERVEIVRGPGSVQYGASAMGGVVNVITKKGHGRPSAYAEGTLGSWNYYKTEAGLSGQAHQLDFSFSASTESQNDYDTADGDQYPNTGFDSKERISANAGWTFFLGNRIGVTYIRYDGEGIGSPSYLSQNDADDYVDNAIRTVDLTYDGKTRGGGLLWKLRYFDSKDKYETFDPENYGNKHKYYRDTDQNGAQAQITGEWQSTSLTAGFDWTRYEIDNTYTTGENRYDNPAVLLLAKTGLLDDHLILSLGGRHDWYEVESDDGESKEDTNWSTSFGAVYKFSAQLSVRANYAEAFMMPTADQLYMYTDYSAWGMGIWSGNPDLNAEKSRTVEFGVDYTSTTLTTGLTWFRTRYEDKIDYAYDAAEDITRYENVDDATLSGLEGTVSVDIGVWLDWPFQLAPYASFTYLSEYKDEEEDTDLQYTPEWTASYGLRLAHPESGLTARLNISTVSKQDIDDYEGTGETTLGGYTVADLTASKRLVDWERYGSLTMNAEIRNLFDESYAVVQGYPSPGRSFFVGLKYTY
ncbi:TonB-dependent receptor plug domain-containing protein [Desulfosarcina ovata]|nr:TonB-dependent receptor [Desulfosarcina ovata]